MADSFLGKYIMIFVTVLVGVVLLTSISDNIWENRNVYTQSNDTIDISTARNTVTGNMTPNSELDLEDNYIVDVTSATLYNDNGSEYTLTEDTDFTVDTTDGTLTFLDTSTLSNDSDSELGNITEFAYTHGDLYVNDSISRTFLSLVIIFFAIGVFLVAIQFKDEIGRMFS